MKNELTEAYNSLMKVMTCGESIGYIHKSLMILSMVINQLPDDDQEEPDE